MSIKIKNSIYIKNWTTSPIKKEGKTPINVLLTENNLDKEKSIIINL